MRDCKYPWNLERLIRALPNERGIILQLKDHRGTAATIVVNDSMESVSTDESLAGYDRINIKLR